MKKRKEYTTDITDEQWAHLRILLPKTRGKGRRRSSYQQRELINAVYYVIHTGCQWRDLPHDFPAGQTVYGYFKNLVEAEIRTTIFDWSENWHRLELIMSDNDLAKVNFMPEAKSVKGKF